MTDWSTTPPMPRFGRTLWIWLIAFVLLMLLLPFLMRNTFLGGRDWSEVESAPAEVRLAERPLVATETTWRPDPLGGGMLLTKGNPSRAALTAFARWTAPWKMDSQEPFPKFDAAQQPLGPWDLSASGRWLLVGPGPNETGDALLWDREQQVARRFPMDFFPLVSIQPTGDFAALVHYQPAETRLMDLATGALPATAPHVPTGIDGRALTWHPTETALVIVCNAGVILIEKKAGIWQTRALATEKREFARWQANVQQGQDDTGYHPAEIPYAVRFFAEGAFLAVVIDQGLRVFSWDDLRTAEDRLPKPKWSFESELVSVRGTLLRQTYDVAFDRKRGWLLWTDLTGRIESLEIETGVRWTLFRFPENVVASRLAILGDGDVLACQVSLGMFEPRPDHRLLLLDLARLAKPPPTK